MLDHVGGHVDPLRVITRIPHGMKIWNLRQRLCQIIHDYRIQTSLQEGCNSILNTDAVHLSEVWDCLILATDELLHNLVCMSLDTINAVQIKKRSQYLRKECTNSFLFLFSPVILIFKPKNGIQCSILRHELPFGLFLIGLSTLVCEVWPGYESSLCLYLETIQGG